jgi:hypothetical protein
MVIILYLEHGNDEHYGNASNIKSAKKNQKELLKTLFLTLLTI